MILPFRPMPEGYKEIGPEAKKVFDGVIFDVYQWPQHMFDGSTETFERLKRPDTVVILHVNDGIVTMVKEEQPDGFTDMDLPMGRVNKGEAVKDGAFRELREETGIVPERLFYVSSEKPEGKIDWLIHLFIATGIKDRGDLHADAGGERISVIEKGVDEYIDLMVDTKVELGEYFLKFLLKGEREKVKGMMLKPWEWFEEVE